MRVKSRGANVNGGNRVLCQENGFKWHSSLGRVRLEVPYPIKITSGDVESDFIARQL